MNLPATSLAEAAVEVGMLARREKRDLDNFEYQLRCLNRIGEELDIREAARLQRIGEIETAESRERAGKLAAAFEWLMLLKDFEPEIKALLETNRARAA